MTTLSSAATSVENAAYEAWVTKDDPKSIAAATLRAVVTSLAFEDFNTRLLTAQSILAVATELEDTND